MTFTSGGAHRPLVVVSWPAQRFLADARIWLSPEFSGATARQWSLAHEVRAADGGMPARGRTLLFAQCALREPAITDLLACLVPKPRSATFCQAAAAAFVEALKSAVAR